MTPHAVTELSLRPRRTARLVLLYAAAVFSPALSCGALAADAAASPAQSEFGGQCVEALAEGRHVMTDCSTSWTDKDGKTYCFSGDAAKKSFLEKPAENLQSARAFMAASSVESTEKAMEDYSGSDAEALVKATIDAKLKANNGIFPIDDPLNGEHLKLSYDDVDFTRTIDGYGYFPDVKFHDSKDAQKKYLIDFWVMPQDGKLQVQETRIYKAPLLADKKWTTMERQPIPWWWIPASEHPGHLATKRGWEVMSAVEQNAMQVSMQNNGVFKLKDDKTGQELVLSSSSTPTSRCASSTTATTSPAPISGSPAPRIKSTTSISGSATRTARCPSTRPRCTKSPHSKAASGFRWRGTSGRTSATHTSSPEGYCYAPPFPSLRRPDRL